MYTLYSDVRIVTEGRGAAVRREGYRGEETLLDTGVEREPARTFIRY